MAKLCDEVVERYGAKMEGVARMEGLSFIIYNVNDKGTIKPNSIKPNSRMLHTIRIHLSLFIICLQD